jgi:hypothetical protein
VNRWKRIALGLAALAVAAAIWIPSVRFFVRPGVDAHFSAGGVPPRADELAARHLRLWLDPKARAVEIGKMRASNAEWDFMGRTFLVLSLANMSLRDTNRAAAYVPVMDAILDETLRLEREQGMYVFLMGYARGGRYVAQPERSLFVDGEIAMMLAARRLVAERADYRPLLRERVGAMIAAMRQSQVLLAESYPDECWMFDHAMALAAMRASDALDGTDHRPFAREWLDTARRKLTHPATGLLCSSLNTAGVACDGPEGSTIWWVAHGLQIVDRAFAADQYARAKKELAREVFGFAFAREWPPSWHGPTDVDSGPIIPGLEASAGSSGLAFVGASAFGDREYLQKLLASVYLAGFPVRRRGELKFCASNQVGDAVLLYAMTLGPLWQEIERRSPP